MSIGQIILAAADSEGVPLKIIIAGVGVLIWILTSVLGKSKKDEPATESTPRSTAEEERLDRIRRQLGGDVDGRGAARPPPLPSQGQRKGKKSKQQARQPVAVVPPLPRRTPTQIAAARAAEIADVPVVSRSERPSETGRNVRLLLQRGGAREAFVLAEILGKPRSMQ